MISHHQDVSSSQPGDRHVAMAQLVDAAEQPNETEEDS